MKHRLKRRSTWLVVLAAVGLFAGVGIAAAAATLQTFIANFGFMLASASLGVGVALLIVQAVLDERAEEQKRDDLFNVFQDIASDVVSAWDTLFDEHQVRHSFVSFVRNAPIGDIFVNDYQGSGPVFTMRTHIPFERAIFARAMTYVDTALSKAYARYALLDSLGSPVYHLQDASRLILDALETQQMSGDLGEKLQSYLAGTIFYCAEQMQFAKPLRNPT